MAIRQIIEITDDRVRMREEATSADVSLEVFQSLMNGAGRGQHFSTGILPRNCIAYVEEPGIATYYVVELPPDFHFIKTSNMNVGVKVAMPWQYFIFVVTREADYNRNYLSATYVYWKKTALTEPLTRDLLPARVPNIDGDALVCFGTTIPESDLPMTERINTIVNEFYSPGSLFNDDIGWNLPSSYVTFLEWASASQENPMCWQNWPEWFGLRGNTILDNVPAFSRSNSNSSNLNTMTFDQIRRSLRSRGVSW